MGEQTFHLRCGLPSSMYWRPLPSGPALVLSGLDGGWLLAASDSQRRSNFLLLCVRQRQGAIGELQCGRQTFSPGTYTSAYERSDFIVCCRSKRPALTMSAAGAFDGRYVLPGLRPSSF